jgi:hypothetical protein
MSKALRHELESLRQRIATMRGPEGCGARGMWTPDAIHGPGYIVGSEFDPDVIAGRACECWPGDFSLPEEFEAVRRHMVETAQWCIEQSTKPHACVAHCGQCSVCLPPDPRGVQVARRFLETGVLEWPEGASARGGMEQ